MNKKHIVGLCILLLSLLLTACGKVRETENAIDAIGSVSMESLETIEYAEKLYDELGSKQSRVDNAGILQSARTEYDRLALLVETARTTITAIGNVTPDSREAITAAQTAWEALAPDGLTGYVQDLYPVLADAEAVFAYQIEMLEGFSGMVDSIGTVNPDDAERIDAAWAAYEALEMQNLAQYATSALNRLVTAESTYNNQCQWISEYIEEVNALGRITLESEEQLKRLELLYTKIQSNKITGYVSEYNVLHQEALAEYLDLYAADFYKQVRSLYNKKEYTQVRLRIDQFLRDYPSVSNKQDLLALKGKSLVELARIEYGKGLTEAALEVLEAATSFEKSMDEYSRMVKQIEQKIASNRPYSGRVLYNKLGGGYGKLKIDATFSGDACVKLQSVADPEKYMLFYVRGGETATVSVPEGTYILKYTTGSTWYSTEEKFGKSATYKLAEDIMEFEVSYSGNYVYYTQYTITLYSMWGGNLETTPITGDAF